MPYRRLILITCILCVGLAVILLNLRNRTDHPPAVDDERPYRRGAMFYDELEDEAVQCRMCFRDCIIAEGETGFCRNRRNVDGRLYNVVHGHPSAVHVEPVEAEPAHHFLPDTDVLCIGTASCNFRCKFCHNWSLSQQSMDEMDVTHDLTPEEVVDRAEKAGVPAISFTYNEPTAFYEYAYDIARLAQQRGIAVMVHTNGALNPEPLRALLPYTDAMIVDLKAFNQEYYRRMTDAELEPVLRNLKIIHEEGVWLEIVNLILPKMNDDPEEIRDMATWIADNLGPEVPLHFSRFFPAYQLPDLSPTPVSTLEAAYDAARGAGLQYVSIGNVPGHAKNSTYCPQCDTTLIERRHFSVMNIRLEDGHCPECGEKIPGIWEGKGRAPVPGGIDGD